jgi:hypothetical protein
VINGEQRWHTIGVVGTVTLAVVVHTYPRGEEDNLRESSARGKRLNTNVGATKRKPLSTAERRQLAALETKTDDAIDTKDIPEAPAANWRLARRGG